MTERKLEQEIFTWLDIDYTPIYGADIACNSKLSKRCSYQKNLSPKRLCNAISQLNATIFLVYEDYYLQTQDLNMPMLISVNGCTHNFSMNGASV